MNHSEKPDYTYEEIRNATIEVLAIGDAIPVNQYDHLKNKVREILFFKNVNTYPDNDKPLSPEESDTFLEVFWDLFRQGIITLGLGDSRREFPFFRVSAHGRKILESENAYFYHDVSSYEIVIKQEIPDIDDVTFLYLREAMQSFYSGCYLSSSVMLGVASEHTFLKLLEKIGTIEAYKSTFKKAFNEKNISKKFEAFKNRLKQETGNDNIILPDEIKENLDSNLDGIMNTIRRFRNDSGHPSGKKPSREQCYVNLNLFIPYCKTTYQLMNYFK